MKINNSAIKGYVVKFALNITLVIQTISQMKKDNLTTFSNSIISIKKC